MKKKILTLATIAICAAVAASGTLAYFTAEKQVHNVITTGAVDIRVEEWQNEIGTPYPDEPIEVMPGAVVSKITTVKNLEADAYVRAKFDIVITDEDGNEMQINLDTLKSVISLTVNGDDWRQKTGDGEWWYYTDAVRRGESTEPFFTQVVFNGPNMTNEYQNSTVDIIVTAQAVQTANNGTAAENAVGWPAE